MKQLLVGSLIAALAVFASKATSSAQGLTDVSRRIQESINRQARDGGERPVVHAKIVPGRPRPPMNGEDVGLTNEQRAFFERCMATAKLFVPQAERNVRSQKQAVAKTKAARIGRGGYPTKDAKQEAVENAEDSLKVMETSLRQLKSGEQLVTPVFLGRPKENEIGRLNTDMTSVQVVSVVDERTCLVELRWYGLATNPHYVWPKEVVMLTGINTEGFVDGSTLRMSLPVKLTGTRSYQSLGGTRTVLEMEATDLADLQESWKAYRAEKKGGARR
jgi:hypothetical protein